MHDRVQLPQQELYEQKYGLSQEDTDDVPKDDQEFLPARSTRQEAARRAIQLADYRLRVEQAAQEQRRRIPDIAI